MKSITRTEIFNKTLDYFKGDDLAANVWINKYCLKDSHGNLYELSPDDMHHRLAKEIARIEKKYENPLSENDIYELLKEFKYIVPAGGSMAGIGNNFQFISLSNCFVVGNNADSYGGIMKTDEEQVQLMKRRGGVGHDLSHIRPKGLPVKNSALTSTGIVPFMERYSNSTREVSQDGRRGALMLSISIKHPDAEDFLNAKLDTQKITGANISVKIDDEFMEAVINNKLYIQQYPIDSKNPIITKEVDAKKLWNKLIENNWKSAEPGILFWDTIISNSTPDNYTQYKTISTNPCGEIPLCPWDSCRLLSINLFNYVINKFKTNSTFNFNLFKQHVGYAQRIMDDIIDLELEKIDFIIQKIKEDPEDEDIKYSEIKLWEKIKLTASRARRTGLGITALGDMLAALNIKYGTDKANTFIEEVFKTKAISEYKQSCLLSKERGAFPDYNQNVEKNDKFMNFLFGIDEELKTFHSLYGRRNISISTIAPNGSVSLMTQTTSGIEPVFNISYKRKRKINPNDKNTKITEIDANGDSWEEYNIFHPKFIEWYDLNWLKLEITNKHDLTAIDDKTLDSIISKSPYFKATANEIDFVKKVEMQGIIQKYISHSISVTHNLPENVAIKTVDELYRKAWEVGCKGFTIYREGSRAGVLVNNKKEDVSTFINNAQKRPSELFAKLIRFNNNKEQWIGFVGIFKESKKESYPYEIFTGKLDEFNVPGYIEDGFIKKIKDNGHGSRYDFIYKDKQGYEITMQGLNRVFDREAWNMAKLFSSLLRHRHPLEYVIKLIESLNFENDKQFIMATWKKGIIRILKKFVKDGVKAKGHTCENCGSDKLIYTDGCLLCLNCGSSACS